MKKSNANIDKKASKSLIYGVFTLLIIAIVAFTAQISVAKAFSFDPFDNPLDPFGIFDNDDDDDKPKKVIKNTTTNTTTTVNNTNSHNTNSNNTVVTSGHLVQNPNYDYNYPNYNYNYDYDYNYHNNQPLNVSCYSTPTSISTGQSVSWRTSVYGGTGNYSYYWSGTDGLSGNGQAIDKTYFNSGTKSATVTVTSGGQTITRQCGNVVSVTGYNPYPPYPYPSHPYITVSCYANPANVTVGSYVTWTAQVSGGSGYHSYSWNGTDGLYGSGNSISKTYNTPGTKSASVTVYSDGQTRTVQCSNYVTVAHYAPYPTYPTYPSYPGNGLQVACSAGVTSSKVGSAVTWAVEVAGGNGQYTYAWTGTDGLTGNSPSIAKIYTKTGLKSAIVTVTSQDGQTASKACANTVNVKAAVVAKKPAPQPTEPQIVYVPQPVSENDMSVASLFSLNNVPWGFVAILVILILLGMVIYLLVNKNKI